MTVLVTGGAGFLGARLIDTVLAGDAAPTRVICVDQVASRSTDPRVVSRPGSITDAALLRDVVAMEPSTIWHLAAVLSGQSEAECELGLSVNVGGTQALLDACRALSRPPRFVFASTIAVFGGPLPRVVPEDCVLRPQSSYGTAKAMAELLVLEYTRRGIVDGVVCRVPTVSVRPGAPNSAVSSFVSGIVREPLNGVDSVCPVPLDTRLWVSSPDVTTRNLAHAARVEGVALGAVRTVNLPGITVTPAQMLDSLERAAGADVRARVHLDPDERISRMVSSWPGAFDTTRALGLGFSCDRDADAIVQQFVAERQRA
jgi:nucleoside-diphosphate-sugar epimerase